MERYTFLAALFCFSFAALASVNQKDKDKEAAALVQRAADLSGIRKQGATPFRLKANVTVMNDDGSQEHGSYTEFWASKAKWRKETALGEFRRTQVVREQKRWTSDSSTVIPDRFTAVQVMFDPWPSFSNSSDVDKLLDQRVDDNDARCFRTKRELWGVSEFCFEKSKGSLVARITPLQTNDKIIDETCVYREFQQFGGKSIPTLYECFEDKKLRFLGQITNFASNAELDQNLFAPLSDAKESINCLTRAEPPKPIYQPEPVPPDPGNKLITMSVQVGTDGTPHGLKIVGPADPAYGKAALDAVRQWRFKPALCGGQPMEVEIAVEIVFHGVR